MTEHNHTEARIFYNYITKKGLNNSTKRDYILKAFLQSDDHLSLDDLYNLVKKDHPEIGHATVYRTLKLIAESGIAQKVDFDDGSKRFEHSLGREFHAHIICTKCGNTHEAFNQQIKQLCHDLTREEGFFVEKQRFEIFGLCPSCK